MYPIYFVKMIIIIIIWSDSELTFSSLTVINADETLISYFINKCFESYLS